jgi:hypothetical protein
MYMTFVRSALSAVACILALAVSPYAAGQDKKAKPSLSLKATPLIAYSPAHMVLTADLRGGADDYQEFYCASIEWDWGDDTKSESKTDCDPYVAGKSEITRHFSIDHTYNISGDYRVEFRLKQNKKVVARASTDVKIRPGIRDGDR